MYMHAFLTFSLDQRSVAPEINDLISMLTKVTGCMSEGGRVNVHMRKPLLVH